MKTPVYMCLHVRQFALQALLRLRTELRSKPVAVLSGEAPLEKVCGINLAAAGRGVRAGMTRAEMESVTGVELLRRSLAEEEVARGVLLEAAKLFTPRMEEQPSPTAFVLVLDMTGSTRIFGPMEEAAAKIHRTVTELGFSGQIVVSSNFLTAVCIARSTTRKVTIVPPGHEAAILSGLPLTTLALEEQHAATFSLWGLRRIGELAELPEEEVVVRLGQAGRKLRLLARGEHPHLMVPMEPIFSIAEYREFDAPVEMMDSLLFVLGPMLDQLIVRARNKALALASVTLRLGLDGGGQHERTIKPALPLIERIPLLKLLQLDLQTHPPDAGVLSMRLTAEPGHQSKLQLGLFSPQLPESTQLEITLARIAALVGEERVGRIRLKDSHAPESFHVERFRIEPTARRSTPKSSSSLALRRVRPPLEIRVKAVRGQLQSVHMQGKLYEVRAAYGPWRKSGQWWTSEVWSYEEWDVAASCGEESSLLALLSHDLLRDAWQLEALYD